MGACEDRKGKRVVRREHAGARKGPLPTPPAQQQKRQDPAGTCPEPGPQQRWLRRHPNPLPLPLPHTHSSSSASRLLGSSRASRSCGQSCAMAELVPNAAGPGWMLPSRRDRGTHVCVLQASWGKSHTTGLIRRLGLFSGFREEGRGRERVLDMAVSTPVRGPRPPPPRRRRSTCHPQKCSARTAGRRAEAWGIGAHAHATSRF